MSSGAPSLIAVLPVKAFDRGKSRLGPVLTDAERSRLTRALFERTLDALGGAGVVSLTVVLTDDDAVATRAEARGAEVLRDTPTDSSLAERVARALELWSQRGATHALICMGDLPLLSAALIDRVADELRGPGDVAIAVPNRSGRGTNVLALALPPRLAPCLGDPDSLAQHRALARLADLELVELDDPEAALDLDTPEDWALLRERHPEVAAALV